MADGLTVTIESGAARVLLRLEWAAVTLATITRVHADGAEYPVRNAEPAPVNTTWVGYDHETPLDAPFYYRATSTQSGTVHIGYDPVAALNANPYFEIDASNWTPSAGATFVRSTAQFHQGVASGLLTPDGVAASAHAECEQVVIVANLPHVATAWVRCAASRTVEAWLQWFTAGGSFISSSGTAVAVTANTWTAIAHTATAPATAGKATLSVILGSTPPAGHTTHIDEAILHPGTLTVQSLGRTWLTHPGKPWLDTPVTVREIGDRAMPARRGVLRPIDRADPIVIHATRSADVFMLSVNTPDSAALERLKEMLADGAPLLLRTPSTWEAGGEALYLSVDTVDRQTLTRAGADLRRRLILPVDVTGRPDGAAGGPAGLRWDDLDPAVTWATVTGTWDDKAAAL